MAAVQHREQGMVLIVSLVFLIVMTLFSITTFNMEKNDLNVVGNMQQRGETEDAARTFLQMVTSSAAFMNTPSTAIVGACNTASVTNGDCFDFNGDGTADVSVALSPAPTCVMAQTILNSSLDLSNSDDLGCVQGATNNTGVVGVTNGPSLCANSVWNVNAVATDLVSGAQSVVGVGAAARTSTDNVAASCP